MILRLRHHHHHHLPLRGNASATVVQRCVPPLCGGLMCGILLEAEQEGLYFLNNVPSFFMFWPRRSGAKTCVRGVVHCPWCPNTSGPGVPGPKQAFAPLRSKGAIACFGGVPQKSRREPCGLKLVSPAWVVIAPSGATLRGALARERPPETLPVAMSRCRRNV